jgi:SAM-dependent methyltransferase
MLSIASDIVKRADSIAKKGSVKDVLNVLRALTLSDFGNLMWVLPVEEFQNISKMLPKMADVEVQNSWTGTNGFQLLVQTCDFIKSLAFNYQKITGTGLNGGAVLDYGCGYGRMLRLMYYFTDPDKLWGIDPWDESIRICRSDRLAGNFAVSDYLPTSLPVGECMFDAIYAFSVFTHTSERATKTALKTLRRYISPAGLCAITIRPKEYWALDPRYQDSLALREEVHEAIGFSFSPHPRAPIDGDLTYGDTSMTFQWLDENVLEWKIAGHDRSLNDPGQIVIFLRPR